MAGSVREAITAMTVRWYGGDDPVAAEDAEVILGHVEQLGADASGAQLDAVALEAAQELDFDEAQEMAEEIADTVRAYWRARG